MTDPRHNPNPMPVEMAPREKRLSVNGITALTIGVPVGGDTAAAQLAAANKLVDRGFMEWTR